MCLLALIYYVIELSWYAQRAFLNYYVHFHGPGILAGLTIPVLALGIYDVLSQVGEMYDPYYALPCLGFSVFFEVIMIIRLFQQGMLIVPLYDYLFFFCQLHFIFVMYLTSAEVSFINREGK
jgi:hypothetical protein